MQPFERIVILLLALFFLWIIYTAMKSMLKSKQSIGDIPTKIDVTIKRDETIKTTINNE